MLKITSKLKRVKYTRWIIQIIIWVVFSPLMLLHFLGILAERIMNFVSDCYYRIENKAAKKFKLDEIARAQYKTTPEKFSNNKHIRAQHKHLPIKRWKE